MSSGNNKNALLRVEGEIPSVGASSLGILHENFLMELGLKDAAVWRWDIAARLCFFSDDWLSLIRSSEPAGGWTHDSNWWLERIHAEDAEPVMRAFEAVRSGASSEFSAIFRLRREDGCWAWVLSKGAVRAGGAEDSKVVSGIIVDVSCLRSDRKFQHGGAGVGDSGYHAMLENSMDLYVRMDRELFPLYINPVVSRYMGMGRDDFTFTDTLEEMKIEPEQLEFLQNNVRRVFDEGIAIRKMVTFTGAHGEFTGEYSFWPEVDQDGRVTSAMTHFRDLTEQISVEKRARLNERRLSALYQLTQMDNSSEEEVLRFVLDSVLNLTRSQSGFIFTPHNDLMGKGVMLWSEDHHDFLPQEALPDDCFPGHLLALCDSACQGRICRVMQNGDGIVPVHSAFGGALPIMRCIIAPGMEESKIVCMAGVYNKPFDYDEADLQQLEAFISGAWLIIRRHKLHKEMQRAKEAAERANKVKDEFLANVSHELRTPLNGMLSMLQLLMLLPMNEEQREYVRTANFSGKALLRIISDILDFSRMESGKMQLQPEIFDFRESVRAACSLFELDAAKRGLSFALGIDERIPRFLYGDDARLRQILFNIVGNALKFTESGSVSVECSLLSRPANASVRVYIGVRDTGIGIPPEQHAMIFDAFTQIDSSSTRKHSGTGLGLAIVKRLVDLMEGGIAVESALGEGTTIHCSLAFALPRTEFLTGKRQGALREKGGEARILNILVAEDDQVGRFAIKAFLQRAGHRVVCVGNGRQALEALKAYPFDCLFTDIQMPEMDGVELVRRIRRNDWEDISVSPEISSFIYDAIPDAKEKEAGWGVNPAISIVAISAHAMSGDRDRFLQEGIDFYIAKPIIMDELLRVLDSVETHLEGAAR